MEVLNVGAKSDVQNDEKTADSFVFGQHEEELPYTFATKKGNFQTFVIPDDVVLATPNNIALGKELIRAFRRDGLLQLQIDDHFADVCKDALSESKSFFANNSLTEKRKLINDLSFSGYIGSGDERTDGKADGSEIFTITPDIAMDDERVKNNFPAHGPCPWPDDQFRNVMTMYMSEVGAVGETLLKLMALGLDVNINTFINYTQNGWFHMRVLRFPSKEIISSPNITRGIGAHTDYGLLVIASQDDVGGLYIRPPIPFEKRFNNWMSNGSMAGVYEEVEPWVLVEPVSNVLTVFPGDMFQLLTDGYLLSTPHKVSLHPTRDRFSFAYFHEPGFDSKIKTLEAFQKNELQHSIEYGTHFCKKSMATLPDRSVTQKLKENNFESVLEKIFRNK